jgi:hypothetical protein
MHTLISLVLLTTLQVATAAPVDQREYPTCAKVDMNGPCPVIDCMMDNCLAAGCTECVAACGASGCANVEADCMASGLVCRCYCSHQALNQQLVKDTFIA